MSDDYYLACKKCHKFVWIGQSQNVGNPFCFYSGEQDTMEALKTLLWEHMGHDMVMEESQQLEADGVLFADKYGRLQGRIK